MSRIANAPVAPVPPTSGPGPLEGIRVIELASEWTAYAGRLLGDLGAHVVLVEPPEGSHLRMRAPFENDESGPERSLWWWHYQSNKFGVTLDLRSERGRAEFSELVSTADVVLEGMTANEQTEFGVDPSALRAMHETLITVGITPFGRRTSRTDSPATDLTLLAGAGPVWSCGYDDHELPPIRGAGNQAMQTAGLQAVPALLIAVLHRFASGRGQNIDVSAHAASNVTTEAGSYEWLVARATVQRQTARHAAVSPTENVVARDVNGRPVYTGVPPRSKADLESILVWMDELGVRDQYPDTVLLELGVERGGITWQDIFGDELCMQIFASGRGALMLIASKITDREFFIGGQRRGFAVGAINAPEDVLNDPHFIERGFTAALHHDRLQRDVVYAGAPIQFSESPWLLRRHAPVLGEHNQSERVQH